MIKQQRGQVLNFFVTGMFAEIEDLSHGGNARDGMAILIAEPPGIPQCPKGRGSVSTRSVCDLSKCLIRFRGRVCVPPEFPVDIIVLGMVLEVTGIRITPRSFKGLACHD